jgi:hypothetical protein
MNLNNRFRPRYSLQHRAQLLRDFARNPGTAREFAARHKIAASTLFRWRQRSHLLKSAPPESSPAGAGMFKQVAIPDVLGPQWIGEVSLPDGTQVRWRDPASVATVQELLGYLRRPC